MQRFEEVAALLADVLGLGERQRFSSPDARLLGAVPELDSMAVVQVIAALEDHFGIAIHDDDISGDTFETVGTLTMLIDQKLG